MAFRTGLAVATALLVAGMAQDAKKQKISDFESDAGGWAAFKLDEGGLGEDSESKVVIAKEAKVGKGALSWSYELGGKTLHLLGLQREFDLSGMKSLRLWVKCSSPTAVIVSLTEKSGASWQASATCAAGAWQEVAVNLDELTPDEIGKDPNGKLDLDEVGSLQIFDIGGFLSQFLPDLKGKRTMGLDEIEFSPQRVALTTGRTSVTRVTPVFLVDNFETPVIRWAPISLEFSDPPKFNLFDAPLAADKDVPADGGKQSLKFTYPRKGAKIHGVMRALEKVDLGKVTGLDLCLKTSTDGTFLVGIEEKDGARYQKMVELKSTDGWKSLSFALGDLTLADDSKDDNDRLDAGEIKQITVADLTHVAGGGESDEVRLWIDEVLFVLAP